MKIKRLLPAMILGLSLSSVAMAAKKSACGGAKRAKAEKHTRVAKEKKPESRE